MMQESSPPQPEKKDETLRTMRSDMAEFIKVKKPSLASLLAAKAETAPSSPAVTPKRVSIKMVLLWGGLVIFLAVIAWAASFLVPNLSAPSPPLVRHSPRPFIAYETEREVTVAESNFTFATVAQAAQSPESAPKTFQRLVIKKEKVGEGAPTVDMREFFRLLGITPPAGFLDAVGGEPQFFTFRSDSGPRFGLMFETSNRARMLEHLFRWEPFFEHDLEPLFLGDKPPTRLAPFQDMTYRNVDFRYLELDAATDRGLGYLFFPVRNLIIMTTSHEALRMVVNRLFELP